MCLFLILSFNSLLYFRFSAPYLEYNMRFKDLSHRFSSIYAERYRIRYLIKKSNLIDDNSMEDNVWYRKISDNTLRVSRKIIGPKISAQFLNSRVSLEEKLRVCLFGGSFASTGRYLSCIYATSLLKFPRNKKRTPTSWTAVKCAATIA